MSRRRSIVTASFAIALSTACAMACAGDRWPEFRGPTADGHTDITGLPVEFSETKNVLWKTPIHDRGLSSPVIWDNQIWLTTATEDGKKLFAMCVDLPSGKILHDITVFEIDEPAYSHPYNSYASATPALAEGKLFVHYGSAGTACLDTATGKTVWSRTDLPCNHFRGHGSSPALYKNLLIIHFDGYDFQYVVALDQVTGETVWKKDRDIDYGTDNGDFKKSYGTPTLIEVDGEMQLISVATTAMIAYDPETGEELYHVKHGGFNTAARPVFGRGKIFINMEAGKRLLAIEPGGAGDLTETNIVWNYEKSTPTRPSQIVYDKWLFMVSDIGVATCLDADSGEMIWTERIGGPHCASPIVSEGRLYFFDETGKSTVIEAGPKFKLLAENQLAEGVFGSPAVAEQSLIVRGLTHLYRICDLTQD
ncbi:MAG: PQQ-binding-like beta-propeller repeat protein [Planctomycetota bacterium]|nr:PQQ-binding-like beta-propeller repeat protein [Planctomycetota bacterium]